MEALNSQLPGVKILSPRVFSDDRGYFFESFREDLFEKLLPGVRFCQDNQSYSKRGVLRGLHYQLEPQAQSKLVRVVLGTVWDVVVDVRKSSPTFKQWAGVELSASNHRQLFVPKGFAHGFLVLSEEAIVQYKVDNYFSQPHDRGIRFDDPEIGIQWPESKNLILSEKDRALPAFKNAELFS